MSSPLETPIQYVKGVGPRKAELLARLGIRTVEDALYFLPFRYEDRTRIHAIRDLTPGRDQTVAGEVVRGQVIRIGRGRGRTMFELRLRDQGGELRARWFNQPYLAEQFQPGMRVVLTGRIGGARARPEILHPEFEIEEPQGPKIHMGRIVPIYHLTKGLGQRTVRSILWKVVGDYAREAEELLPPDLIRSRNLLPLEEALRTVHFPPPGSSMTELQRGRTPAHRRLAYEQALLLQLAMTRRRAELHETGQGRSYDPASATAGKLKASLPFQLTRGQVGALKEILADLESPRPMNRLLQGEVGSGKTIVALFAMLVVTDGGSQAAIMAPTEILAQQHYLNLKRLLAGISPEPVLLTASVKGKDRKAALQRVASGDATILVGTHALLTEDVEPRDLGLVVVDEQHRFGVLQRARLQAKGLTPDVLVMTATPIPRSLALTVFGDLEVSTIRELPRGRKPVRTVLITEPERSEMIREIRRELRGGRQAFVICPVIEESQRSDLRAARQVYRDMAEEVFPELRVGLLHGKLKAPEREEIMGRFARGELDLLVSTTVVEVGVDIQGATVMVVEHADRFGLAQLHQLRGRVGRGDRASTCYLVAGDDLTPEAQRRLEVMIRTGDGFEIAEEDLMIRGPGEFLGVRQSGVPEAALLGILRYSEVLEEAHQDAQEMTREGWRLPALLARAVERRWSGRWELGTVG